MNVVTVTEGAKRFTANAYLVMAEDNTLIDVGTPPTVADEVASHVDRVDQVIVTHGHPDHIDQLPTIVDRFDPAVYMFREHPLRTHELANGDTVSVGGEEMEVLHTPGHADDHVVLIGEKSMFSGDIVVYNDGAFDDGSFGKTDGPNMSREVLIDSIDRLLERLPQSVSTMYAGHGDIYRGDVRVVVERALERARRREPKYPD